MKTPWQKIAELDAFRRRYRKDAAGHEHSAEDGKFVSGGGQSHVPDGGGPSHEKSESKNKGGISKMPETEDQALALAFAARDELVGDSDDDVAESGQCIDAAREIASLSPEIEIYEGTYPGDYDEGGHHYIVKAGDFFIDVTADQFGGHPVRVFQKNDKVWHNYYGGFRLAKKTATFESQKPNGPILDALDKYDGGDELK